MILADTSGLLCLLDAGEPQHAAVRALVEKTRGPVLTTDLVLAETDFLIGKRLGAVAEARFVDQLVRGAFRREPVEDADVARAQAIIQQYADLELGLTDATLMALAERLAPCPVLTLDRRHFAAFRDKKGRALALLPEG